jgi:hypothetical protein
MLPPAAAQADWQRRRRTSPLDRLCIRAVPGWRLLRRGNRRPGEYARRFDLGATSRSAGLPALFRVDESSTNRVLKY